MFFGSCMITDRSVQTHRDSYLIANISVISVRRPFLPGALLFVAGGTAFTTSFIDLLYAHEIAGLFAGLLVLLILGLWLGQLKLLSRDLRGSELSGMLWGSYPHLNRIRSSIVRAIEDHHTMKESSPRLSLVPHSQER